MATRNESSTFVAVSEGVPDKVVSASALYAVVGHTTLGLRGTRIEEPARLNALGISALFVLSTVGVRRTSDFWKGCLNKIQN